MSTHEGWAAVPRPEPTPFGTALKRLREARSLSQAELGRWTGLTNGYISRLESGQREPSREAVVTLADALALGAGERYELLMSAGLLPDDAREFLALWFRVPLSVRLELTRVTRAIVAEREDAA